MNNKSEVLDVLIIGAGISGIGLAWYLQKHQPNKKYSILEARERLGGTWDLFRYPGIRSDSDLYTFGYEFKPWTEEKSIADASSILKYVRETAEDNGIDRKIQYGKKVSTANWNSERALWEVTVTDVGTQTSSIIECKWLFSAGGYYRYDQGYTPEFKDIDKFKGQVVHPQHWPEDLNYKGKKVVVIGSGATAVTLIPAMADQTAHITMLQRTPTYVVNLPAKDPIALALRKVLPEDKAYDLIRLKNVGLSRGIWRLSQSYPNVVRKAIRLATKKVLPKDYPVDVHFNPPYNPWDQRLCAVPNGDLFKVIRDNKASIVTDHIDAFTENGIRLKSGQTLEADIVVTATGLNVQLFGGIELKKDNQAINMSESLAYKGFMLSNIPNFAFAVGYTNSSWTLKVGLVAEHFCRLLGYMDQSQYDVCEANAPEGMPTRPLLDFGAGYVKRALDHMPKQGASAPWLISMDFFEDSKMLREGPVVNPFLNFSKRAIVAKKQPKIA